MKEKVSIWVQKLNPIFNKLGQNFYLQAISTSMMATLGPIFLGSIAVLLLVFPIEAVPKFLEAAGFAPILSAVNSFTIGAMALYVVFLMAKNLVTKFEPSDDGVMAGIIALMCFFFVTPLGTTTDEVTAIPTTWLGAQGVFSAMIIGLLVGRIYVLFKQKNMTIKMPEGVPPMVFKIFESLFPSIAIGILFILINRLFVVTPFGNMHQFVYSVIQEPLKGIGGSIFAVIIIALIQQILWFFGIHGTNVVMPIMQALWMAMDVENLNAIAAGLTPPNITGYAFFSVITWGGTSLGLVLLMLRAKSKQYREVGKVSIIPILFGIGEPVVFGTPLVLNFKLAIPLITNNSIALFISYILIKLGIVARFTGTVPIFGLPLGAYAAIQGRVSIIVLQLFIQLILGPLLWYPWFKRLDKETYLKEQRINANEEKK